MATKTIAIPEDVHQTISQVQLNIRKKYGINLKLSYIVTSVLKRYAESMEDILREGFSNVKNKEKIGIKSEGEGSNQSLVIEDART